MKRENWEQVKEIFNAALELETARREVFLAQKCAGDEELRRDVETLLASFDAADSFLQAPAVETVAELLVEEQARFQPGQTFSHYEILQFIGAGGMGEVYLAQDLNLNRRVALKFLSGETIDANSRKRFVREAQAAATLEHPNICSIYEISDAANQTFIAMQYVAGKTLAEELRAGKLSFRQALEIAAQIADALSEAHRRGVVHRDIKPANIMLAERGRVKVLDFGLAKILTESEQGEKNTTLSIAGLVMGTAAYMSPEQARGLAVDARTDVWSLGVVLYEMLTGKPPFAGDTTSDIIAAILRSEPAPLADFGVNLPPQVEAIIAKSLAKNQADRYQSAAEMLDDLQRAKERLESAFEVNAPPPARANLPAGEKDTDEIFPDTNREITNRQVVGFKQKSKMRGFAAIFAALAIVVSGALGYQFYFKQSPLRANFRQTAKAAKETNLNKRTATAIVGFNNLSNAADAAWLSPALSEMLSTELASGGKLLVVPQETVARMKSELSINNAANLTAEDLQKIWANINAEAVISGSYTVLNDNSGEKIRLDVRAFDAATGETLASIAETGAESELFEIISRAGARLRDALGGGLLNENDKNSLRASQPKTPEAARFYAEGREKSNNFDFLGARDSLERAVVADPQFAFSHHALALAFSKLGADAQAKAEAERAFELSGALRREERLTIEGFYHEISGKWDKAIEIYKTLFDFFPDNLEYGLRLAAAQNKAAETEDAAKTIAQLRNLPAPVSDDPRIDIAEADTAEIKSDYERELTIARSAFEKGRARNASLLVAEARYYEGWAQWNLGNKQDALAAYEEARQIYAAAGRRKSVADILNAVATIRWKSGEIADALRIYQECLAIDREIGARSGEGAMLNNIGNVYRDQSDLANARRYYEESLLIYQSLGDKSRTASTLFNVASVRRELGDLREARALLEKSIAINREIGKKSTLAMALQELALTSYFQNDLAAAQKAVQEALALAREIKRRSSEAYALATAGKIALARNDFAQARALLENSLKIRRELEEEGVIAETEAALAELALAENRPDDALALAQDAVAVFNKEKDAASEAEARAILAKTHLARNEIQAASEEIEQAVNLLPTTENKESRFAVQIIRAEVLAAQNCRSEARQILRDVLTESNKLGFGKFALDARRIKV